MNISIVKPTVAKLLSGLPKLGRSTAVLQSALQRGELALELLHAEQTALAVPSSFLWHTEPLCSGADSLIMQVPITGRGDLISKSISTLWAAIPRAAEHCALTASLIAGFTPW